MKKTKIKGEEKFTRKKAKQKRKTKKELKDTPSRDTRLFWQTGATSVSLPGPARWRRMTNSDCLICFSCLCFYFCCSRCCRRILFVLNRAPSALLSLSRWPVVVIINSRALSLQVLDRNSRSDGIVTPTKRQSSDTAPDRLI